MNADKIFLSDEEIQNTEHNAQRLAEIMDVPYSIVGVGALTPRTLIGIFGTFLKTIAAVAGSFGKR